MSQGISCGFWTDVHFADVDSLVGGQGDEDCAINKDVGNLCSQMTAEDCLGMVAQNQLMLEMLLEHYPQWTAPQSLGCDRMVVK